MPTFRIITLLITILCILFAIPSSAQPTPYYKLVTSSDELVAGEQYIIWALQILSVDSPRKSVSQISSCNGTLFKIIV